MCYKSSLSGRRGASSGVLSCLSGNFHFQYSRRSDTQIKRHRWNKQIGKILDLGWI